jgi:hypothetical protein
MKFSGSSSKSKKNLEEMMKDYKKFVKKYFGNANPRDYLSEERIDEIIEGKDKKNINQNVILQNEKNYLIYEKLVKNNIDSDFVDEDIEIQIPSSNEIYYSEENRLGKHKNNINDYNKRKKNMIEMKIKIMKYVMKNILILNQRIKKKKKKKKIKKI